MPIDYDKNDPYHRNILEGPRKNMREHKIRGMMTKRRQIGRRGKREAASHKRKKQKDMR